MKRLVAMFLYFCMATLLAEAGVLAVLWQRGALSEPTLQNLATVAYDVPVREVYDRLEVQAQPVKKEMVSFAEVEEARTMASLDMDLRELSSDKGLIDLRELESLLDQEKVRYTQLKEQFDARWDELRRGAADTALQDVRRQIESLQPKAAKDQLLRLLDNPNVPADEAMNQVVTIMKGVPVEKRKKILAEFKEADGARLHSLLTQIRLGMPETKLIRETKNQLQQFQKQDGAGTP